MNGFYMTRCTFISVPFLPNIDMTFEQRFLAMTEKRKETQDNNEVCAAALTDLSFARSPYCKVTYLWFWF